MKFSLNIFFLDEIPLNMFNLVSNTLLNNLRSSSYPVAKRNEQF